MASDMKKPMGITILTKRNFKEKLWHLPVGQMHGIGKKTVDIAMDYVNGKEVADIPAQVVGIDYCSVNKSAMKTLGISEDNIKTDYKLNVIEN